MKRWELLLAIIGACAVAAALLWPRDEFPVAHGVMDAGDCRIPYTRYQETAPRAGSAIIFHGLAANRRLMEPVARAMAAGGLRAYTVDLPGHGENTEPFSIPRAEQCASAAVRMLTEQGDAELTRLAVVGHSLGGGIAIRMADRYTVGATVAISPAPLTPLEGPWKNVTPFELPLRLPSNLLVLLAQFDPYPIRDSAKLWVAEVGGDDDSDTAFRERRALRLTDVPLATHTTLLVDAGVARESVAWVRHAFEAQGDVTLPRPPRAFLGVLAGLLLLFPAVATIFCGAVAPADPAQPAAPRAMTYFLWAAASVAAIFILRQWIPLAPLHLFTGDYFASLLLLVGAITGLFHIRNAWRIPKQSGRRPVMISFLGAVILSIGTVLAVSATLNWQVTDLWLNAERWRLLPYLALAVLPWTLAEEWALGVPRTVWRRLLQGLALRSFLWSAMLAAFLFLHNNQVLLPLLTLYLLIVSIAQRLGADAVRRRSGSAAAAAAFSAILAAWFIAAVFPLT